MSIRDDLKAFLDGELSPERAAEVALAMEKDPELQSELTFMKDTSQQIKAMAKEATLGDARQVIDGLRPPRKPWLSKRLLQATGLAAAVFLVAVIAFPLFAPAKLAAKRNADASAETVATMAPDYETFPGNDATGDMPAAKGKASPTSAEERSSLADQSFARRQSAMPSSTAPSSSVEPKVNLGPRLVIRNGSLGLRVADVRRTVDDAIQLVAAMGGYSENTSFTEVDGKPRATMTFRVPATKFDALLTSLHGMGEISSETLTGDDVTLQVADVEARVKTLRIEEEQYRIMLKSARRVGEILEIKQRIANVRMEIESLDAQRKALRSLASMSTLTLTLDQKLKSEDPKPDDWFEETTIRATNLLKVIGQFVGQALTFLVILAPIWLPIAGFAWWTKRRKAG